MTFCCGGKKEDKTDEVQIDDEVIYSDAPCKERLNALKVWYEKAQKELAERKESEKKVLQNIQDELDNFAEELTDNQEFFNWGVNHEADYWDCQFRGGYKPFLDSDRCEI